MKTLVLSDIHANLPALEAVLREEDHFDVCLFLGDVVDYGPFPNECIAFLEKEMDFGVIGNHDNALAFNVDCGCRGDFKRYSEETRTWHRTIVGTKEIAFLRTLQPLNQVSIDGHSLVLAHATPQGDLFTYMTDNDVDEAVEGITAQIVLLGHTHIQFRRQVGNTLVVNPGSVGLARDGGQACYAVLENGEISLNRLTYNVERTIAALQKGPVSQSTKDGLSQLLRGEPAGSISLRT